MAIKKFPFIVRMLLSVGCLFFLLTVSAQPLDSLENRLREPSITNDEKLSALDDLSWGYLSVDPAKSIEYARQGIELATNTGADKMVAVFNRNLGVAFYMESNYDSAVPRLQTALSLSRKTKDKSLEANTYLAFGNLYLQTSDYSRALEYLLTALRAFEQQGMNGRVLSTLHNIGALYQRLRNPEQAVSYFNRSLKMAREMGNLESEGMTLMALTNLYMDNNPGEALRLATHSQEIFKKTGNFFNEIMAVLTIAQIHYTAKRYSEASVYAQQGLKMAESSHFPKLIAEAEAVLSNIHYYQKHYKESKMHAQKSLAIDSSDLNLTVNMMANILRSSAVLGESDEMVVLMDKYIDWATEFANASYQGNLSEMQVKYETEKKELKIGALEKERRFYIGLGIVAVIFLITLLALLVVRHRLAVSRQKLARHQLQQLQQEKQLVAVQAALDGETAERSRLARDLHDGLGSMLSAVKFTLPELTAGVPPRDREINRLQKAVEMLDSSTHELRRIAHHMMPETLADFGLRIALTDFCESVPRLKFSYYGTNERLPEKMEIMIYRSIHELVNNALKHARAERIRVQLVQDSERISFTVEDDGIGFDADQPISGMGLQNIKSRIDVFQGRMHISSSPEGTEINIELQINPQTSDENTSGK